MPNIAHQARLGRSAQVGQTPAVLVVFNGQSNAKGYSSDPRNSTTLSSGYGFQYYPASTDSTSPGVLLPLGNCLLGRTGGGPQRAFCQAWTALAGGTAICVDAAVPGASMDTAAKQSLTASGTVNIAGGTYDLSDGTNVYESWVRPLVRGALAAAARNGFAVRKIIWLWVQGETDAGANALTNGTVYATKLTTYIDRVVTDFAPSVFCISELGTNGVTLASSNSYWNDIRSAQSTVVAARSSIAVLGSTAAKGLFDLGQMVDTLHYTQAGYNTVGADLAAAAHAFVGAPKYRAIAAEVATKINSAFPYVGNFARLRVTHVCSGNFFPAIFSDPTQPYSAHWIDATGTNPATGDQTLNWTFTGSDSKQACLYVHSTASAPSYVPASADKVTRLEVLDKGLRVGTVNAGTSGSLGKGFYMQDLDFQRFAAATFVSFNIGVSDDPRLSGITNATLTALGSGLTTFSMGGARLPLLDYSLVPNVTNLSLNKNGLTTADVNTVLQAIDASGKSNGTLNTVQFNSSPAMTAAPPSGAGATAKTSLQGRGWSVTTD